jgi:hypothetical protein
MLPLARCHVCTTSTNVDIAGTLLIILIQRATMINAGLG